MNSKNLKEYLSKILNKDFEHMSEDDLKEIKDIKLSRFNFLEKETDHNLNDLKELINLKSCTLYKFDIQENEINILKNLKELEHIYFDFCNINLKNMNLGENVQSICFSNCQGINEKSLNGLDVEKIKIIGSKKNKIKFDFAEMEAKNELVDIHINNFEIENVKEILVKCPNLKIANFDGSIIDSKELDFIKENIEFSNKVDFVREG